MHKHSWFASVSWFPFFFPFTLPWRNEYVIFCAPRSPQRTEWHSMFSSEKSSALSDHQWIWISQQTLNFICSLWTLHNRIIYPKQILTDDSVHYANLSPFLCYIRDFVLFDANQLSIAVTLPEPLYGPIHTNWPFIYIHLFEFHSLTTAHVFLVLIFLFCTYLKIMHYKLLRIIPSSTDSVGCLLTDTKNKELENCFSR